MKWKVVSTHFGKLENALNRLSDEGFAVWKLVILAPESTRTKRFVVIIVAKAVTKEQSRLTPSASMVAQADRASSFQVAEILEEAEPEIVTIFSDDQKDGALKKEKREAEQGKLGNSDFRPNRRMGRFDVIEPSK